MEDVRRYCSHLRRALAMLRAHPDPDGALTREKAALCQAYIFGLRRLFELDPSLREKNNPATVDIIETYGRHDL